MARLTDEEREWGTQPANPKLRSTPRAGQFGTGTGRPPSATRLWQNRLPGLNDPTVHAAQRDYHQRIAPVEIPATPLRAALGNVGSPPTMAPAPDTPAPVAAGSLARSMAPAPVAPPTMWREPAGVLPRMVTNAAMGRPSEPMPAPLPGVSSSPGSLAASRLPTTNPQSSAGVSPGIMGMGDLGDPSAAAARFNANADAAAGPILEAARAMGQQRHADSPQGQRVAADIARITSTYRPDFGPGAAMAGRENALAAVAQPAGPSWSERAASSREGMLGMVGQALANQGGLPSGNLREDVASLAPGTTLRGTSDLGTPMVASRGNAQPVHAETRQAQTDYLANRRDSRAGRLREAVFGNAQRQAIGRMQQQQAIAQQQQGQMFQNLFARDPQAATQLMAAMGQQQIGMGQTQLMGQQIAGNHQIAQQRLLAEAANARDNVGLRRREMRQQHELAKQELIQKQGLTDAQAEQAIAAAERSRAESEVIRDAGSPEGQVRSALLGSVGDALPEVMAADFDLQDRIRGAVGDALRGMMPQSQQLAGSADGTPANAQRQPIGPSNAAARLAQTTPIMQSIFGEDVSGWSPSELLGPILERAGGQGALSDTELARVQQHLQYMAAQNPDLARPSPGLVNRIFGGEQGILNAGELFDAMMGQQPVTSGQVAEILGSGRQRLLTERQRRDQARRENERAMQQMMFAFPRMGPG